MSFDLVFYVMESPVIGTVKKADFNEQSVSYRHTV